MPSSSWSNPRPGYQPRHRQGFDARPRSQYIPEESFTEQSLFYDANSTIISDWDYDHESNSNESYLNHTQYQLDTSKENTAPLPTRPREVTRAQSCPNQGQKKSERKLWRSRSGEKVEVKSRNWNQKPLVCLGTLVGKGFDSSNDTVPEEEEYNRLCQTMNGFKTDFEASLLHESFANGNILSPKSDNVASREDSNAWTPGRLMCSFGTMSSEPSEEVPREQSFSNDLFSRHQRLQSGTKRTSYRRPQELPSTKNKETREGNHHGKESSSLQRNKWDTNRLLCASAVLGGTMGNERGESGGTNGAMPVLSRRSKSSQKDTWYVRPEATARQESRYVRPDATVNQESHVMDMIYFDREPCNK